MRQKVLSILALLMVSVVSTTHLHAASLNWYINAVYQSANSSATASGYAAYMFVTANTTDVTVSNVTTLSDVTTLINQGNISDAIALATVSGSVSNGRISTVTDISINFSTGTLTAFAIIFDAADAASAEHYFLVNGGSTSSVTFTSGTGVKTIRFGDQNSGETSSTVAANWRSVRAPATKYALTLADGTDDTANWTISPTTAEEGQTVTITYNGTKNVKSVKAVKKAILVTGITLNKTATTIVIGSTETLRVTAVTPDNASDKTVTWSSDKESVATVDANGKVTAVAAGTANITATANDGSGVSATCAVTVTLTYPIALSAVTSDYVGSVVCSDGNVYPAKTAAPAGKTAVGILGKVTETGHGLILALKDAEYQNWSTINGWASVDTYAGTTLKVLPDDDARGSLASYTTLGSTAVSNWAVAQKSDYKAIFINLGSTVDYGDGTTYDANVNAYITTGVGGTAISDGYNWTATEYDDDNACYFYSSGWDSNSKTLYSSVRPVLGF